MRMRAAFSFRALDTSESPLMREDNCPSAGYPGLNTLYCIHTVTLRARGSVDALPPHMRGFAIGGSSHRGARAHALVT